ncbi:tRNA (guanosine(37)-N1)-methyltransferase TrmD [Anaerorhabdus sp.]|uniref:tRNA (guanosine(37)-N1)-methyltransferase TrmD n=1 Tax=Anaerorhabdus sp. TaxID=1872524 RepID=UPI002FC6F079
MRISILTLFPEMFDGFINTSIIARAIKQEKVTIECINIRDFTLDKHNHVDDTPFGGGRGMVMMCQPVLDALQSVRTSDSKVYLLAAAGETFNQKKARSFVNVKHLILICGHYEGLDARIYDEVDGLISIGDYILTGGELASMIIADAVIRLLEGVIVEESHLDESFENGLLEYPHYTKPVEYNGKKVPDVLLSGHHENIRKYRLKESLRNTYINRPDLLSNREYTKEEYKLLDEIKDEIKSKGE